MSEVPQSPIVEKMVLSLMARDETFRRRASADGLGSEHFHAYEPVFSAIDELGRAGEEIDAATLSAALEHNGKIVDIGGHDTVREIFGETTDGRAWRQYVRDLRKTHAMRLQRDGLVWANDAATPDEALEALRATHEAMKEALAGPSRAKNAQQVMAEVLAEMKRLHEAGDLPGISTGMADLDGATGGMKGGQLWTVLAQTSRGKSVLMTQLGCAAIRATKKVAFFSVEMMTHEVGMRIVSHTGPVLMENLTQPRTAKKGDFQTINNRIRLLADENFWVDDTPKMTLAHVEREAHRLADENDGLDVVVVDYLQILKAERGRNQSREEAVAGLSHGLKQLAKALRCTVLTGSQVNKKGDSRESDAIIFDSDVALMIGDDGIKLAKVRNGPKDKMLPYRLNGAIQTFEVFTPEDKPAEDLVEKQADDWPEGYRGKRGGVRNKQFKS